MGSGKYRIQITTSDPLNMGWKIYPGGWNEYPLRYKSIKAAKKRGDRLTHEWTFLTNWRVVSGKGKTLKCHHTFRSHRIDGSPVPPRDDE